MADDVTTVRSLRRATFSSFQPKLAFILDIVLPLIPLSDPVRVLDIGCGSGDAVLALAEARPAATFVGLDLSPSSVHQAEERRRASPHADRLTFLTADYVSMPLDAVDVILCDSVLHLIPGLTSRLFAKLASEVVPGGLVAIDMPYWSTYNQLLADARRVMRQLRGPVFDALSLQLARAVHRGDVTDEQLRERLVYNYIPPLRFTSDRLDAALARTLGLDRISSRVIPPASPAQLRHRLTVYRRRSTLKDRRAGA